MKKMLTFSLMLINAVAFNACSKKDDSKPATNYSISVNVDNGINFSIYEPNQLLQTYNASNLMINASTTTSQSYQSRQLITVVASIINTKASNIELIVKKTSTGEVVFQGKQPGQITAKFTPQ